MLTFSGWGQASCNSKCPTSYDRKKRVSQELKALFEKSEYSL